MPTESTVPAEADVLADLLDGRLDPADVPAEYADLLELAELADQVRTFVVPTPPTDAFREALRERVTSVGVGPASSGAAGATGTGLGTAGTASGASGGLAAVVAGLAATAVLATSTVAAADRAGPGDLLAGLDRAVESTQLLFADDVRDAELLVGFAAERVLEALDLVDPAAVGALLGDAEDLLDRALQLGIAQGRDVDELVRPYAGALLTLSSRTDDPAVRARVDQLLDDLGATAPAAVPDGAPTGGADQDSGGQSAGDDDTSGGTDGDAGSGASDDTGTDEDGGVVDQLEDAVDDATDELEDTVDDIVDDVTDPLEDVADDLLDDPLDGETSSVP